MSENVYATPESELITNEQAELELASRWSRLGASIVDGLTIMAVTIPVMLLTGGFDGISDGEQPSLLYSILIAGLGIFTFYVLNAKSLMNHGQTVGKKLLNIKIVDMEGELPGKARQYLTRYAVYFLPGQIPVIGQLFSFINILCIFGKAKRCIHDLVANTQVVKCN